MIYLDTFNYTFSDAFRWLARLYDVVRQHL